MRRKNLNWCRQNAVNARDGLGRDIDKGILQLITLLNYHGIATIMSCYGHKQHGHNYPWVDVDKNYSNGLDSIIVGFDLHIVDHYDSYRLEPKHKNGLFRTRKEFNKLNKRLKRINKLNNYSTFIK